MHDIFLSYAREDQEFAEKLVSRLGFRGLSVWWDRRLVGGEAWHSEIEGALENAKHVVVLWSRASVSSTWVKSEALRGLSRNALIPLVLEEVKLPLGLDLVQTIDFKEWDGAAESEPMSLLVVALQSNSVASVEASTNSEPKQPSPPEPLPYQRKQWLLDKYIESQDVFRCIEHAYAVDIAALDEGDWKLLCRLAWELGGWSKSGTGGMRMQESLKQGDKEILENFLASIRKTRSA